ncbi:hypothetical protein [Dactylosporangium sp. CA-139066]|uniref:hypothetical protein n=1 Tax=Dactylosporangium sp. CA-139066 TaxID=3239930 RepID=UPI003D8CCA10
MPVLVDKMARYEQLAVQGGPAWPVLFLVPNGVRERQLRDQLGCRTFATPAATATVEGLGGGRCVADAVWLPLTAGERHRLIELDGFGDPADDAALARLDRPPRR